MIQLSIRGTVFNHGRIQLNQCVHEVDLSKAYGNESCLLFRPLAVEVSAAPIMKQYNEKYDNCLAHDKVG